MTSEALYNLDRPDEQTNLKLKDASPKELIKYTYRTWYEMTGEGRSEYWDRKHVLPWNSNTPSRLLYDEACKIIRPFRDRLSGQIRVPRSLLHNNRNMIEYEPAGLYLSAVLNETRIDRMVVGELPFELNDVGYRLKPGKVIEVRKNGIVSSLGRFAEDGIVINHGQVGSLGSNACGGIWLNCGKIEHDMGGHASGGIWLNNRRADSMGYDATGGIFLARYEPRNFLKKLVNDGEYGWLDDVTAPVYGIGPKQLKQNKKLSGLIGQIERAGKNKKFADVEILARKIDSHVRNNYKPRKVA